MNKRITAALAGAAILVGAGAATAQANPGLNVPVTCEFQSTWTKTACTIDGNTYPWNYSVTQIKASPKNSAIRSTVTELCGDVAFISWPYGHFVVKGDTLWNIALRAYGDGQKYRTIMTLNSMSTTTIKIGQWIIVKPLPAECVAANPYAV